MADANNLDIQKQLNQLLEQQKRILRDNTRNLREQANLTRDMVKSLGDATFSSDVIEKSRNLKESLRGASDEAKNLSRTNKDMASAIGGVLEQTDGGFDGLMQTYSKATNKAGKWGALTGGFIEGVFSGVKILKTGLSGVVSVATTAVGMMFSLGKSILSIPFKIFNEFINEANRMQGAPLLAKEFEETRKAFGDFGEDLSKHVVQGYRNLRGELAETGLSTYRVLGFMHEQLKFVREQFEALGAVAHVFGKEIAVQSEHFAAYQKGLGLSGDMMKSLAQTTQGTGDSFEETLRTTTKFTTNLGKRFGISQKVIGRDIGEMTKDLKTFGSVGVREMAQMSTFARKLGADFKDLLGVVDKFDNFEDAAESAARLAQAFGLNVDAMEMINEQDPAARIEMLRKAFFQTGKDITKLSRQERNYLAATAGIEDQALNAVFALENQGKTYEDISQAGQEAEQQQITQAEAMEKLSDSIERLIKSGQRTGGFFDRFMQGFRRGIRWTKEFRQVMRNIKRSLWATERAGRRVGRAMIKHFPGLKKFLKGMKDFFDPKKFKKMGGKVVSAFTTFFKELGDPTKAEKALGNLLDALNKAFFGMVDGQKGAMSKIIEGIKKGFKAVGQIILSATKIAIEYMAKFFKGLTDFITSDKSFFEAMAGVFDDAALGAGGFLNDVWFQISKQLGPASKKLWKSFKGLLEVVWEKIKKWWNDIEWGPIFWSAVKSDAGIALMTIMFGPAVIKAGIGLAGKAMEKILFSNAVKSATTSFGGNIARMFLATGPIGLAVGAFAATLAAAFIYTSNVAEKEYARVTKSIKKDIRLRDKVIEQKKRLLEQSGLQRSVIEDISNMTSKQLTNNIALLTKQNDLTAKQLELIRQTKAEEMGREVDQMREKRRELIEKLHEAQRNKDLADVATGAGGVVGAGVSYLLGGEDEIRQAKAELEAFDRKWEDFNNKRFDFSKKMQEKTKGKEFEESLNKAFSTANAYFGIGPKGEKTPADMTEMVRTAKELKPKELKKIEGNIKKAKEIILKKGGIKDQIFELNAAFSGVGQLQMSNVSDSIGSLSAVQGALAEIGNKRVKDAAINNIKETITTATNAFADETFLNGLATISYQTPMISGGLTAMGKIADNFESLENEITEVKTTPIVRGISSMVKAANHISHELGNIDTLKLKPKLENLGKVLGLKGTDKLRIEHENFNFNVDIVVKLDPTELADAVMDSKKFVKSIRQPG